MRTLIDLLRSAAATGPDKQLFFHEENTSTTTTYSELNDRVIEACHFESSDYYRYPNAYTDVQQNSKIVKDYLGVTAGQTVLLHLDSQANYVTWFWFVIATGAVPVVSTPLPADGIARDRHLMHLKRLLNDPVIITTVALKEELAKIGNLNIFLIEDIPEALGGSIPNGVDRNGIGGNGKACEPGAVAFLMLTSGSTGGAKAVEITHAQVLASLDSKSQTLGTSSNDIFLNWIGFDHVACVTEVHLHAMSVGATQVHLDPKLPIRDPIVWLKHLSDHSVSITFAPNFFLAATIKAVGESTAQLDVDLSSLRIVVSGGEANKVSTGVAFNNIVKRLGAMRSVLCPAFGMTETCAGSIYNMDFPGLEDRAGLEFCSVGKSTHAMEIRIVEDGGRICGNSQHGNLELSGPAVFGVYHNDHDNTMGAYPSKGWFRTGDVGCLDSEGNLILSGRTKDSIIINGVKYFSHELEAAVEEAAADYIIPSYTSAFPIWTDGSDTEEIIITFLASTGIDNDETLSAALKKIENGAFLYCSRKPIHTIPLPLKFLEKSSLGKLSRASLKKSFESGHLDATIADTKQRMSNWCSLTRRSPETSTERLLAKVFADEFTLFIEDVSLDDSLADMGVDSMRLLRFKGRLQQELGSNGDIPIGLLLTNPTIQTLAKALSTESRASTYEPVVVLQSGKAQAVPIWFIHPGLGEVLVFLNISRYFSDREVLALRAPGLNPGEEMFSSIDEMTSTYVEAILRRQTSGPYVLIGYSFGSMIAFEATKKLEAAGHEVFMGSLNGPPHIKWRMVQIDWCELFLNLSYFLGFITEEEAVQKSAEFHEASYTKDEILGEILAIAPSDKLAALDLDAEKLAHWADVSSRLQGLAHNYDPTGKVQHIDVFYAKPLLAVSRDKEKWLLEHLHRWNDFCQEPVRFHDSPGAHYTMLDPDHVFTMQKILRGALRTRVGL